VLINEGIIDKWLHLWGHRQSWLAQLLDLTVAFCSPSRKIFRRYLRLTTISSSFLVLLNSLFINEPFVRRHNVRDPDSITKKTMNQWVSDICQCGDGTICPCVIVISRYQTIVPVLQARSEIFESV
jgi:hypothetical protein